jgi:hypothetical protein
MSAVTERLRTSHARQLRQRLVEPTRTCDGVESEPIPYDLLLRGGTIIPGPNPVFAHDPQLTADAAVHSGRMLSSPPCDILLCARRQWLRRSTFLTAREGDKVYTAQRMTRYAFSSPQIDVATIATLATQLRVYKLLMETGTCKPKSDKELLNGRTDLTIRRFKFDHLLPHPNEFIWPDGGDDPSDPSWIFQKDGHYEYTGCLSDPKWVNRNVGESLYMFRSLSCEVSVAGKFADGQCNDLVDPRDSPIDLYIKEDLTIEKRERDGALRGVDHYVFVVNPDRISFVSKCAE